MSDLIELVLDSMAHGGEAVGRFGGKVFFVDGGAPGDRVKVRVVKERSSFCRAEIAELLAPGPGRREPPCDLADRCGGCQLLHLGYEHQAREKEAIFTRALEGKVDRILPMVPSSRELGYRRRARMQGIIQGKGQTTMGYVQRRSRQIVDVESCPLLEEPVRRGLALCRERLGQLSRARGTVSVLAGASGEVHLSLRSRAGHAGWRRYLEGMQEQGPVVGITASFGRTRLTVGRPEISLLPSVKATAAAFAQANTEMDSHLRSRVAQWAEPAGKRVLELYAGVGNLTSALAPSAREVVAVESSSDGGRLLQANAKALDRVTVLKQTAEAALTKLAEAGERFDVVVMDPPREGCRGLGPALAHTGASRLVYISCDPMILARDLEELRGAGFIAEEAEPLDMMPQTFHIEGVARLTRSPSTVISSPPPKPSPKGED